MITIGGDKRHALGRVLGRQRTEMWWLQCAVLGVALGQRMAVGIGKGDITGPVVQVAMMGYADPRQKSTGKKLQLLDSNRIKVTILAFLRAVFGLKTSARKDSSSAHSTTAWVLCATSAKSSRA